MLITYIEDISFLSGWRSIFVIKAQIASCRADYLQKTKYLFTGEPPLKRFKFMKIKKRKASKLEKIKAILEEARGIVEALSPLLVLILLKFF